MVTGILYENDPVVRPIPGFPGYYADVTGGIWSSKNLGGGKRKIGSMHKIIGKIHNGYRVVLLRIDGHRKYMLVNRLMLLTFVGEPPTPYHHAAHENGDRGNNRLENLSWKTPKENTDDQFRHGTKCIGSKSPHAKLTESDVRDIRSRYSCGGISYDKLAEMYGVTKRAIACVIRRIQWKHVE